jgi:UDP-N-acetyl-alpha-D-muramoyl-L-alanyl-L-glutamate epimerase
MGVPLHVVNRTLDPQLISMQQESGAYKGHVPISLIFALVGSLLALTQSAAYVVVANELSASTSNAKWADEAVNHQWSKSFAFESSLQNYIFEHVSPQLHYFSAIRPLSSVAVAKAFAKLPQYFEVFTSDNFVFRIDPSKRPNSRWSLESPKSLSSFILLSPWIPEDEMLHIFGINFLNESSLKDLFLSLIGLKGEPPLDCVGTVEELGASVHAIVYKQLWPDSSLLALTELASLSPRDLDSFVMTGNSERFPAELKIKLLDAIKESIA